MTEIDQRFLPISLHRSLGHPQESGRLGEREPTANLEVHGLGEARLGFGQAVERLTDGDEICRIGHRPGHARIERGDLEPAATLSAPRRRA